MFLVHFLHIFHYSIHSYMPILDSFSRQEPQSLSFSRQRVSSFYPPQSISSPFLVSDCTFWGRIIGTAPSISATRIPWINALTEHASYFVLICCHSCS